MAKAESELHRRLRLLERRLNLFDRSRTDVTPQGHASGPSGDPKSGARRG
jgi:hypothetical protein